MKKRVLSFVLAWSMMASLFFALPLHANAFPIYTDDFIFEVDPDTLEATLVPAPVSNLSGDVVIPSEVHGYPVTSIQYDAFYLCPYITSITFPDSLTALDMRIFGGSDHLEKVIIPDSIIDLGEKPFSVCQALKEIVISEDNPVFHSEDGVLFDKNKETLIKYPDAKESKGYTVPGTVKTIHEGAFNRAGNLEMVALPKGVTTIESGNFLYCSNIKRLYLPRSLKLAELTFRVMHELTDVYYGGSKDEWEKLFSDYDPFYSSNAKLHCYSGITEGWDGDKPVEDANTFQFASGFGNKKGKKGNSIATYEYDDNFFASTALDNYNHDLAKMSLRLAMSAFAYLGESGTDYTDQDANVRELLEKIGFSNTDIIGYDEKPRANTIGAIAGYKPVTYGEEPYTLIALAIRGGNYGSEWGGNFNVGAGEEHEGFQLARKQVIAFLQEYVKKQEISGNVKLWITGYSRAAATANLTAAYLDRNPDEINSADAAQATYATLTPENIYAYCFETPAGTRAEDREDETYHNIYNIVNQNDFVPMVAPEAWGYGRYGVTYFLPSPKTNYDYKELVSSMYAYYNKYAGEAYKTSVYPLIEDFDTYRLQWFPEHEDAKYGFYLEAQNSGQTLDTFLQETITSLTKAFPTPAYYSQHLEEALVFVGDQIMGAGKTDVFLKTFQKEFLIRWASPCVTWYDSVAALKEGEKTGILRNAVKATFEKMDVDVTDEALDGITKLLIVLLNNRSLETFIGNIKILPVVHFPELCLAWMDSVMPSKFRSTRKVIVNCPVNLDVYDSDDELVASIQWDTPVDIPGSSIVAYVDSNGQKVVHLPSDEEFRVDVTATEDCAVTYSVHEENGETGATKVINYHEMTMAMDDVLHGVAENLTDTERASYSLTSDVVEIAEQELIENANPVLVTVSSEGNGSVSGGGTFYPGEFVQLTATSFECEYFLGWYDGETLVSWEETYRFQVTEETMLTGKFSEDSCQIQYKTDNDELVSVQRIYKGDTIWLPEMTQNPNYMILGVYTDPAYTYPVSEEATYTEDTVLYAKTVPKDNWVQFDRLQNKLVVYSRDYLYDICLVTATYQDGKLMELQTDTVELEMGKNEFENPIADIGAADTLKIFVWTEPGSLKPVLNNCVADLRK